MRILLVNKYYYLKGGAERYLFNLKRLLELHGHTVEVFAMQHPRNASATYQHHFVPYIDFHHARIRQRISAVGRVIWSAEAARRIARVLDDFRPDLVHLHNTYHQLSPSILPPITQRQIPIIQRLHDYKLLCPNYQLYTQGAPCTRCRNGNYFQAARYRCVHGSRSWSLLAALEMTLHKAGRIYERSVAVFTSPSRFLKNMAESCGLPGSQIRHIPNFLFPDQNQPSKSDGGYIAYIGRLSGEKGLPTLLRAMQLMPQVKLVIVGEGPLRLSLEQLAQQQGLSNVNFAGYVQGIDLTTLMAQARCTIVPSEWYEVFGQSITESLAVGTPVIASNIGGIPEIVDDGVDGLLFPPGDAEALAECIRQLWEQPQRAREMGERGRQKILTYYTPERHYADLWPLYQAVIAPDAPVVDEPASILP